MGYPGTMGSKFYDYIIADKIVIPEENRKYFSEEVIYFPNCYQANQEKIEISVKIQIKKILVYRKINLFLDVLIMVTK